MDKVIDNKDKEILAQTAYIEQLSEKERHAYEIAKDHLGMSFDLSKSNGFLKWRKKHASNP